MDALVFTDGIGEHAAAVRARAKLALASTRIGSGVSVLVIPTDEERKIARHVRLVIK